MLCRLNPATQTRTPAGRAGTVPQVGDPAEVVHTPAMGRGGVLLSKVIDLETDRRRRDKILRPLEVQSVAKHGK